MTTASGPAHVRSPRRVFILLSSRSLPYAHLCVRTMLANAVEPVHLRLLGDDPADVERLETGVADIAVPEERLFDLTSRTDISDALPSHYPHIRDFFALHDEHPRWREIIDLLMLSESDVEAIMAYPDRLFPIHYILQQFLACKFSPHAVKYRLNLRPSDENISCSQFDRSSGFHISNHCSSKNINENSEMNFHR